MEGNQGNNNVPWPPPGFPVPSPIQQGAFFYFYPFHMGPYGASIPLPPGERSVRDFGGQASGERSVRDFGVQASGERSVRNFCGQTSGERSVRDFCGQASGERSVRDFCGQTSDERSVRDFCCQTSVEVETSDVSTQTSCHELVSPGEDLELQRPLNNHIGSTTAEKDFAFVQTRSSWSQTQDAEETGDGNVETFDLHGPWHCESGIFGGDVHREPIRDVCRVIKQERDVAENGVDQPLSDQSDQQQDSVPQATAEPPLDAENHAMIHEPDDLAQPIEIANVAMEASPDPSASQRSMTEKRSFFDTDFHGPFRYECGTWSVFVASRLRMEQVASPFDPHPSKRPRTEIPSSAAEMEDDLMAEIYSEIDGEQPEEPPLLNRVTADTLEEVLCRLKMKRDSKKLQTRKKPRRRRSRKRY